MPVVTNFLVLPRFNGSTVVFVTKNWIILAPLVEVITLAELSVIIDQSDLELILRLCFIEIRHFIQSGMIRNKSELKNIQFINSLFGIAKQYLDIFNSPQGLSSLVYILVYTIVYRLD